MPTSPQWLSKSFYVEESDIVGNCKLQVPFLLPHSQGKAWNLYSICFWDKSQWRARNVVCEYFGGAGLIEDLREGWGNPSGPQVSPDASRPQEMARKQGHTFSMLLRHHLHLFPCTASSCRANALLPFLSGLSVCQVVFINITNLARHWEGSETANMVLMKRRH